MDLTNKKTVVCLLKQFEAAPLKRLGQNFLISSSVKDKIIKAAEIDSKETILEIGPGIGTLTQEIASRAEKVIAIEKDGKMSKILKAVLEEFHNVEIIKQDFLKTSLSLLKLEPFGYKVIANLPYYIASPAIRKLLTSQVVPKQSFLMVQKEVAQRITAKPPKKMNLLAISVSFFAATKILFQVGKSSFWPKPRVDSAFIEIKTRKQLPPIRQDIFFKILKSGFANPRKQLVNNLHLGLKLKKETIKSLLEENGVSFKNRAEDLNLENWLNLAETFEKNYSNNFKK